MSCEGNCSCKGNSEVTPSSNDRVSDDDVWADDDDEEYQMTDKSTADLRRIHTKQGYLDGLTKAQESSLQTGFDNAFPKGACLGIEVGRILSTLMCYQKPELLSAAEQELNITKVLNKQFFDNDLEPLEVHDALQKWKNIVAILENEI